MKKYTHNEAMFILLLRTPRQFVTIRDIRNFTKIHCTSECFNINSRANNLRMDYKYDVPNETKKINGVSHSCYKINVTDQEVKVIRKLYLESFKIPLYTTVQNQLKPKQLTLI